VQCAVVIQATLKTENASLPPNRRIEFRIGINLGDVMVQGEQIYGDGVNIAARLESLADPGGICISGTVHEHIKNKLTLAYEDLGEQQVKNIAEPVRVWRVVAEPAAAAGHKVPSPPAGEGQGEGASGRAETVTPHPDPFDFAQDRLPPQGGKEPKTRRLGTAHLTRAALILVGLLVIGGIVTLLHSSFSLIRTPHSEIRNQEALPLPDKPSIAVLPFVNMSEDPKQDYFSDGLTEDLTSDLSQISSLFVISRNSAFTYKGKAVKLPEVSRELGVRYVVEGSVRKAGDQVRITAQLVDATQDQHLWSERYDRPLTELFALQDEIRRKIVFALKVKLTPEEQERFQRAPTNNLEAYDFYLRGMESRGRAFYEGKKEANAQARQMFERAVELDPQYAGAYAALSLTYFLDWFYRWSPDPTQSLERAFEMAQRAVVLDDSLPGPHQVLGFVYVWKKQHAQAITEAERAIPLNPNDADGYETLGRILVWAGRPEEAIGLIEKAMRLNPQYPPLYSHSLGWAYSVAGRYEEALAPLKKVLTLNPNFVPAHSNLAICYAELGRLEEARAEAAEILRLAPNFSLEIARQNVPYKDPADLERMLDGLRKAGLK
jgi:adenylate cyclase